MRSVLFLLPSSPLRCDWPKEKKERKETFSLSSSSGQFFSLSLFSLFSHPFSLSLSPHFHPASIKTCCARDREISERKEEKRERRRKWGTDLNLIKNDRAPLSLSLAPGPHSTQGKKPIGITWLGDLGYEDRRPTRVVFVSNPCCLGFSVLAEIIMEV